MNNEETNDLHLLTNDMGINVKENLTSVNMSNGHKRKLQIIPKWAMTKNLTSVQQLKSMSSEEKDEMIIAN